MKLIAITIGIALSFNCFADGDWCDKSGNYNETYCKINVKNNKIEKLLGSLEKLLESHSKNYPKYKTDYNKIYSQVSEILKLEKSLNLKKCEFEHDNYLYMHNLISRGSGESEYLSLCEAAYQDRSISFLESVLSTCNVVNEETKLPCSYQQLEIFEIHQK